MESGGQGKIFTAEIMGMRRYLSINVWMETGFDRSKKFWQGVIFLRLGQVWSLQVICGAPDSFRYCQGI